MSTVQTDSPGSLLALVRPVSHSLGACQLSFVARSAIDVDLARAQHAAYVAQIAGLGCRIHSLDALDDCPDAVFVEDTAVVLDEVAVVTRPGAASRRAETASMQAALAAYRPLGCLQGEATLDGGDVLRLGRMICVGLSARSNAEGHRQLQELVDPFGYRVVSLRTRSCLHLKSAVSELAPGKLLVQPRWLDTDALSALQREHQLIEVHASEPHAANVLRIGESVLVSSAYPRTADRLAESGLAVQLLDVSELHKAEGALTCCSVLLSLS